MSPVLFGRLCFALETSVAVTAGACGGGGGSGRPDSVAGGAAAPGVHSRHRQRVRCEALPGESGRRGGGARARQNEPFIICPVSLETHKEEKLKHTSPPLWLLSRKKYWRVLRFSACLSTKEARTTSKVLI